jgi:hypothetical protein
VKIEDVGKQVKKILEIIDDEEDSFTWGGSEDSDGGLSHGSVDFDRIRKAVNKLIEVEVNKDVGED